GNTRISNGPWKRTCACTGPVHGGCEYTTRLTWPRLAAGRTTTAFLTLSYSHQNASGLIGTSILREPQTLWSRSAVLAMSLMKSLSFMPSLAYQRCGLLTVIGKLLRYMPYERGTIHSKLPTLMVGS